MPMVASAGGPKDCVSLLMVCLGSMCRSSATEAVQRGAVESRRLCDRVLVDSCGSGVDASFGSWTASHRFTRMFLLMLECGNAKKSAVDFGASPTKISASKESNRWMKLVSWM